MDPLLLLNILQEIYNYRSLLIWNRKNSLTMKFKEYKFIQLSSQIESKAFRASQKLVILQFAE